MKLTRAQRLKLTAPSRSPNMREAVGPQTIPAGELRIRLDVEEDEPTADELTARLNARWEKRLTVLLAQLEATKRSGEQAARSYQSLGEEMARVTEKLDAAIERAEKAEQERDAAKRQETSDRRGLMNIYYILTQEDCAEQEARGAATSAATKSAAMARDLTEALRGVQPEIIEGIEPCWCVEGYRHSKECVAARAALAAYDAAKRKKC